jgi:hypothetical protein
VPPFVRATLKEFFASILATGAQVYLPIDVVCSLTEQPPPPPVPEQVEGEPPVEAPPPPEPLPEQITVDLRPALHRAAAALPEGGPVLDVGKGWLRLVTPEERAASVETIDSWLDDVVDETAGVSHTAPVGVPDLYKVRDIGPETIDCWKELMRLSRGLIWYGTFETMPSLREQGEQFLNGTNELITHVETRHLDEGDDEDEEEEEEEEEEEDEDGNPIEREPQAPKPIKIPSAEFETSILLGDVARFAENLIDTSNCTYLTPSEEVVELFRGRPLPGLAKLQDKPPPKKK